MRSTFASHVSRLHKKYVVDHLIEPAMVMEIPVSDVSQSERSEVVEHKCVVVVESLSKKFNPLLYETAS